MALGVPILKHFRVPYISSEIKLANASEMVIMEIYVICLFVVCRSVNIHVGLHACLSTCEQSMFAGTL